MASISPITDAVSSPRNNASVQPSTHNVATTQGAAAPTAAAAAAAAASSSTTAPTTSTTATGTTTQPLDLVFNALATAGFDATIGVDSALDEELFTPPTAQAAGAFSIFMDQLLSALAAQQAAAAAQAQSAPANTTDNTPTPAATAVTQATASAAATAIATEAFVSNSASDAPNSILEGNVQALASQVQANIGADEATTNTTDSASTLAPLQQSFADFIASAGGTTSATALPTFLQALATNLHTVPSPLGNLVDSVT